MSRLKLAGAALALAVAAAAGFLWFQWRSPGGADHPGELVLYGNVDIREARLAFQVGGRILELAATEGQRLAAGDPVGRLEDSRFRQRLQGAEAALQAGQARLAELEAGTRPQEIRRLRAEVDAAEAQAANAEHEYLRLQGLEARDVISPQSLDNAETAMEAARARLAAARQALALGEAGPRQERIDAARAEVRGAEARLETARTDLADTRLAAPSPGVVRARVREAGEVVAAGEPVYTLALDHQLWVRVYIPEPELGRVRPGTPARVVTDSFPDRRYAGWIGFISPTAEFTPKSVATPEVRPDLVYEARVMLCEPAEGLRLGMPATVRLDTAAPPAGRSGACGSED